MLFGVYAGIIFYRLLVNITGGDEDFYGVTSPWGRHDSCFFGEYQDIHATFHTQVKIAWVKENISSKYWEEIY